MYERYPKTAETAYQLHEAAQREMRDPPPLPQSVSDLLACRTWPAYDAYDDGELLDAIETAYTLERRDEARHLAMYLLYYLRQSVESAISLAAIAMAGQYAARAVDRSGRVAVDDACAKIRAARRELLDALEAAYTLTGNAPRVVEGAS